jgi:hypothetical protein
MVRAVGINKPRSEKEGEGTRKVLNRPSALMSHQPILARVYAKSGKNVDIHVSHLNHLMVAKKVNG